MADNKDQANIGHSNHGNNPAPSEDEMPDAKQVEERVQSGDERRSAQEAFSSEKQESEK